MLLSHIQYSVNSVTSLDGTWGFILRCDLWSQSSWCAQLDSTRTRVPLCRFPSLSPFSSTDNGVPTSPCVFSPQPRVSPQEMTVTLLLSLFTAPMVLAGFGTTILCELGHMSIILASRIRNLKFRKVHFLVQIDSVNEQQVLERKCLFNPSSASC